MILPPPFAVLVLETEEGSIRFHDVLAGLGPGQDRPPWAVWVLNAVQRTRTDVPDDDTVAAWGRTYWFRLDGPRGGGADLPRNPCPGVRLYLPGDDAPVATDPLSVRGAQFILPAVLARFLRRLEEGLGENPATAPETEGGEPEPADIVVTDATVIEPEPEHPVQTSTPPVPLIAGVTVIVESRLGGGWFTTFARGGRVIASDEARTPPWADPRAPGRLTTALKSALDRVGVPIERRAIREIVGDWIATLQDQDGADGIISAAVARVTRSTDGVQIELTHPPIFTVALGDAEMSFTNAEMAGDLPRRLNELWMAAFYEALGANKRDWVEIREYWLSIAERGDPWGDRTPYDGATSALQIRISAEPVFDSREGLTRSGLFRDSAGVLWISNAVVQEVLGTAGGDLSTAGFSAHLRREGLLVRPSTVHRVGGITVRAWGFAPEFRAEAGVPQVRRDTVRIGGDEA